MNCGTQISQTDSSEIKPKAPSFGHLTNRDLFKLISSPARPHSDAIQQEWEKREISVEEVQRLKDEIRKLDRFEKKTSPQSVASAQPSGISQKVIKVLALILSVMQLTTIAIQTTDGVMTGRGLGFSLTLAGFGALLVLSVCVGLIRLRNWSRIAYLAYFLFLGFAMTGVILAPQESVWYERYFSFSVLEQFVDIVTYAVAIGLAVFLLLPKTRALFTSTPISRFNQVGYYVVLFICFVSGSALFFIPEEMELGFKWSGTDFSLVRNNNAQWTAVKDDEAWTEKYAGEPVTIQIIEKKVTLNPDFTVEEATHMIFKVQNEAGKAIGEVPLPYNQSYQEVLEYQVTVRTPDGRELSPTAIQDLNPFSGDTLYSDERIKVATMPDVVPGSEIHLQTKILTKKPVIPNSFSTSFGLMNKLPVRQMIFELTIPKNLKLEIFNLNTSVKPEVTTKGSVKIYRWKVDAPEPFEPESYMPPLSEISQEVIVTTLKDWTEVARWYWKLVQPNVRISTEMKTAVSEIVKGVQTDEEKLQKILEYVWSKFRYVSMALGENNFMPHPSDEVFKNKYGDCKDQVVMTLALLKEAGIQAYPVLFRRELLGDPQKVLPLPSAFDHAILRVEFGGKHYYVDPLAKGYHYDEIPMTHEGAYVLVVNEGDGFFDQIPILDETYHSQQKTTKVIIRNDASALVETTLLTDLPSSAELRSEWKLLTEKQKQKIFETFEAAAVMGGGKVFERDMKFDRPEYGRLVSYIKYEKPHYVEMAGNMLSFGSGQMTRDPAFMLSNRKYPYFLDKNSADEMVTAFVLPSGSKLVSVPQDLHVVSIFQEVHRTYEQRGGEVIEKLVTRFKRAKIGPGDFQKIHDFNDELEKKSVEKIMISKG